MSKKELEKAINNYVKEATKGGTFPTGWVVLVSLAPMEGKQGSDSYLTMTSEGLPLHSTIGLMDIAKSDISNGMMLSSISQLMGSMMEEGDDSDE